MRTRISIEGNRHLFLTRFLLVALIVSGASLVGASAEATPRSPLTPNSVKLSDRLTSSAHNKQVPAPEQLASPLAFVRPANGRIAIRMVNLTGAAISYQAIGDTSFRTLAGNSEINLKDLPIPTSLTFRRDDGGLLNVAVEANNPPGTITMTLRETTNFSDDRTTLSVERSGAVYLN
jgi:hypothetical protein